MHATPNCAMYRLDRVAPVRVRLVRVKTALTLTLPICARDASGDLNIRVEFARVVEVRTTELFIYCGKWLVGGGPLAVADPVSLDQVHRFGFSPTVNVQLPMCRPRSCRNRH